MTNERPIGRHPTDPADGAYLCPNDILLGMATTRAPSGSFNEPVNTRQIFEPVQSIADCLGKWDVQMRNAMVGDNVIVQDANVVRSEWKIAIVSKGFPDNNGVVRRCEFQYKWTDRGKCGNKFNDLEASSATGCPRTNRRER